MILLVAEDESLALQVTGAYEKEQTVFGLPPHPAPMQPLTFHLNLDLEAEISARLTPDSNVKVRLGHSGFTGTASHSAALCSGTQRHVGLYLGTQCFL